MARSLILAGYLLFARHSERFAKRTLDKRLANGKEDPTRIEERLGNASRPRPDGRLIWFHAASVGESLSILELVRRLLDESPDLHVMITTGTVTSAKALEQRMPDRMFHQYVPLDSGPAIERFLDHWRPDLVVWTESELWPATLVAVKRRNIPLVMANARMSVKSFRRWRWWKGTISSILRQFDFVMAQDGETGGYLTRLGLPSDRLEVTGSLKEGSAPLPHDEMVRAALARAIGGRTVWLAASTHPGEEEIVIAAHRRVLRSFPDLFLILVPRHPERGDAIAAMLRMDGWTVAQRSAKQGIERRTEIYLADTIGEMGLWFRLSPVTFMGGSLVDIGGRNPFEPAALGSAVLHGPHVQNFTEAYARLNAAGACVNVIDGDMLAAELEKTLVPERTAALATAAWDALSEGANVTDRVLDVLKAHLKDAA